SLNASAPPVISTLSLHDALPIFFFPSYFPSPAQPGTSRTLHVRSEGPAAALAPGLRDLVTQIDSRVPILELGTLDQTIRADTLQDRKSTRLNSSHVKISYAVFCL